MFENCKAEKISQSTIKYPKIVKIHKNLNNDETTFFRLRKYGLQMLANWSLPKRMLCKISYFLILQIHMGQVTKLRLSCYLVLLSIDSKTR